MSDDRPSSCSAARGRSGAAVGDSALRWTVIRPDWVDQDFETFLRQPVIDGHLCVPVGDVAPGLVDGKDIAAVATRAPR